MKKTARSKPPMTPMMKSIKMIKTVINKKTKKMMTSANVFVRPVVKSVD